MGSMSASSHRTAAEQAPARLGSVNAVNSGAQTAPTLEAGAAPSPTLT